MRYEAREKQYVAIDDDGREAGEVTYQTVGASILIIDHTYVDPTFRGRGIAEALVKLVVDQAIAEKKTIIPLCPFAAREFERKPEYQAVKN